MTPNDILNFFIRNKDNHDIMKTIAVRSMMKKLSKSFFTYMSKKRFAYATKTFDEHMAFFQHFDQRLTYLLSNPTGTEETRLDTGTFRDITTFYSLVIKRFVFDNLVEGQRISINRPLSSMLQDFLCFCDVEVFSHVHNEQIFTSISTPTRMQNLGAEVQGCKPHHALRSLDVIYFYHRMPMNRETRQEKKYTHSERHFIDHQIFSLDKKRAAEVQKRADLVLNQIEINTEKMLKRSSVARLQANNQLFTGCHKNIELFAYQDKDKMRLNAVQQSIKTRLEYVPFDISVSMNKTEKHKKDYVRDEKDIVFVDRFQVQVYYYGILCFFHCDGLIANSDVVIG